MTKDIHGGYHSDTIGSGSRSDPLDDSAADGADEVTPPASVDITGSLVPGSTADGSPTSGMGSEQSVERTAAGKPSPHADAAHPDALIEGNRVATADDME